MTTRNILTSVSIAARIEKVLSRRNLLPMARRPLEGLSEARPLQPLAILDIKMPRMDGMELLRRLRPEDRPSRDLPDLQG